MDTSEAQVTLRPRTRLRVGVLVIVVIATATFGIVAGRSLAGTHDVGTVGVSMDHEDVDTASSEIFGSPERARSMSRSQLVVWGLIQVAPECQPAVEISGAPREQREMNSPRRLESLRAPGIEAGYENVTLGVGPFIGGGSKPVTSSSGELFTCEKVQRRK